MRGSAVGARLRSGPQRLKKLCIDDWQGTRALAYGLIVALASSLAVIMFYLNHPQPDTNNDTIGYLNVAQHILTNGNPVDPVRTPGYPSLIALAYLLAGQGNLSAVSIAQGILFVLATLEIYILTLLVLRRPWIALCVGLLMGTSTYLLGFVKPIIVEGVTLWLTVTLALVVVLFIRAMKPAYLWLAAGITLVLFMTRPEWVYLPIPLALYLLLLARRRGLLRRMLPHSLATIALLYVVLGLFIYANATEHGYAGITYIQNENLVGKVLQYHMQAEAPPQYASIVQIADPFVQRGGWDPNHLVLLDPSLGHPYWKLGGAYATSIILHHPLQFLLDTVPVLFTSSKGYSSASPIDGQGAFAAPLAGLDAISADVYRSYEGFLLFVALWVALLVWRRTRRRRSVEMMGAIVLLAVYELVLTSVGGYVQYWRLHIPFDPLMTLIIWGTALASVPYWKPALDRLAVPWRAIWRGWLIALGVGLVGAGALAVDKRGARGALDLAGRLPLTHPLGVALLLLLVISFSVYVYRRQAALSRSGLLAGPAVGASLASAPVGSMADEAALPGAVAEERAAQPPASP